MRETYRTRLERLPQQRDVVEADDDVGRPRNRT